MLLNKLSVLFWLWCDSKDSLESQLSLRFMSCFDLSFKYKCFKHFKRIFPHFSFFSLARSLRLTFHYLLFNPCLANWKCSPFCRSIQFNGKSSLRLKFRLKFWTVCFLATKDDTLQLFAKFLSKGAIDKQVDGRI